VRPLGSTTWRAWAGAACAGLLLLGAGPNAAQKPPRKPVTHTVTIDSTKFSPEVLAVRAGDTVVWVNKDLIPHTATSKAGGFDSLVIATGKSWEYKTSKKGDFPYVCTFHPTMKARLRVR
jgi:plastocyanin